MAPILIAGCGYVGTQLAQLLIAERHDVYALRRTHTPIADNVKLVQADLANPDTLQALPPNLDCVAYTAAADASNDAAYERAYVTGLRNLIDALRVGSPQVRRIVFTSSTGVYEQSNGEWVDESSPTEPASFTGTRLLEGERLVYESGFPATVLRLGGIYGPGRSRLIEMVRAGAAACTSGPPQYTNLIHRDDCAGALRHLLFLDDAGHPETAMAAPGGYTRNASIYIGVDCEPVDRNELLRWIADQLGIPHPPIKDGDEIKSHRPRGNKRCRNQKLLHSGYTFRYPTFREGFGKLIR